MIGMWVLVVVASVLALAAVALRRAGVAASEEAAGLADAVAAFLSDTRPALALLRTEEHRARDRLDATRWGSERGDR